MSSAGADEAADNLRQAGFGGPVTKVASGFEVFVNGIGLTQLLDQMNAGAS